MYHLEHFNSIAQNLCFQGDNKFGNFNAVAFKTKKLPGNYIISGSEFHLETSDSGKRSFLYTVEKAHNHPDSIVT